MNYTLKVEVMPGGFFDLAGRTVVVSKRRVDMLKDFSPVWKMSVPDMKQNVMDVWNEGQSTWAPLNPDYLKWKAKSGYSTRKNVRKGQMFGAMHGGQVNIQAPTAWSWGIDQTAGMWYEGASAYPVHANRVRPFMRLTATFIKKLRDVNFKKYLASIFKRGV